MIATPTKLKNGSWGARVQGTVSRRDVVTITTRGGKSWEVQVDRVLWIGQDRETAGQISLCATSSLDRPAPQYGRYGYVDSYGAEYCGGTCPVRGHRCSPQYGPCHDCE